ncbi:MAG: replication-associated recombination protein A, partial [Bdellovibrionaceae bacterium]|nr:replication-associated recombination protein A [Pseudobdellovibrionaceae bacterium]
MDLFNSSHNDELARPLSEELRPKSFKEFFETGITTPKVLPIENWLSKSFLPNLLLWGPPGTGKTSFSRLLENQSQFTFIKINAVETGSKEIKQLGEDGRNRRKIYQKKTILFIDEIHRLNKAQQDVLLPFIESGDLCFVGATTENPFYELNKAILSRCRIIQFHKLTEDILYKLYLKACTYLKMTPESFLNNTVLEKLIKNVNGDVRQLYNTLEMLYHSDVNSSFSLEDIEKITTSPVLFYDKHSDQHYDHISAFIKSIRGSDSNAALLYMVKMLSSGEDPLFIARRLVILASEDIGNADPRALNIAINGLQALELIGLPEGEITLAQVVTYLCSCPKSNRSYLALKKAKLFLTNHPHFEVPSHLRSGAQPLGKETYHYPHDFPKSWVKQHYLPKEITLENDFYEPTDHGFEKNIKEYTQ